MSLTVFAAVIAAALLHAVWNACVKGGPDVYLSMSAIMLGHTPYAVLVLAFAPAPAPKSWPYLATGVALHFGYQIFLLHAYRIGDLTQVYPIARGTAPLLVAAVSVAFLGVQLGTGELAAVCIIAAGIMSLGLTRRKDGLRNTKAALLALATGGFIASYSLVDGTGARLAGSALGFYGWLSIGNAILLVMFLLATRPATLAALPVRAKTMLFFGGGASFAAYALVIWAFTQAPIALVTALRETSIIYALFIGVFFLKERLDLAKVASTLVTIAGVALLRLSRH